MVIFGEHGGHPTHQLSLPLTPATIPLHRWPWPGLPRAFLIAGDSRPTEELGHTAPLPHSRVWARSHFRVKWSSEPTPDGVAHLLPLVSAAIWPFMWLGSVLLSSQTILEGTVPRRDSPWSQAAWGPESPVCSRSSPMAVVQGLGTQPRPCPALCVQRARLSPGTQCRGAESESCL